ncbi:hypothetical protein HWV62_6331 [Athelia sp. TMB]|nr:hypothetical protein HWV62_6331 [Athelia sp. TMB]
MSTTSFLRTALRARPRPRQPTAGLGRYARQLSASVVSTPTQAALDDAEIDVAPLAPADARIELTDRAAEQLRSIAAKESNPDAALRIAVESGGCHGYQYKMELAKTRGADDYHFTHPTLRPSNLLVDAVSLSLLNGSTIDYATELIGSSFRVVENPNAKGSGCGCGVSWELKE